MRRLLLLLFALVLAGSALPLQAQEEEAVEAIRTAPVIVDGRVLYAVRGLSGTSAEDRAALIRGNIVAAARDLALDPGRLALRPVEGGLELRAGERPIRTVFDADARLEGVETPVLANVTREVTGQAMTRWREDRSPAGVTRALRNVALLTVALAAALAGIWGLERLSGRLIRRHVEGRVDDWERRARNVVRLRETWRILRRAIRLVFVLLAAAAALVYLDLALLELPWTRDAGRRLGGLLAAPLLRLGADALAAIPNLIVLAVIIAVTAQAMRLATRFFEAIAAGRLTLRNFDPEWSAPTARILRAAVLLLGLVMAYPYIPGSSSEAFKAISIFAGIMLSLGATSMIANVVAGNSLIYRRAFRVGDRVEIAGVIGDVEELTAQATYVRTLKNERVTLPNAMVLGSTVTNYTSLARREGLILHAEVGIGYETPWREVEAMLLAAAARTEGVLAQPAPFVLQKSLGDFAPVYEINVYTHDEKAAPATLTRLFARIQEVFAERGVQIMTPHYMADPAEPKLPPAVSAIRPAG